MAELYMALLLLLADVKEEAWLLFVRAEMLPVPGDMLWEGKEGAGFTAAETAFGAALD